MVDKYRQSKPWTKYYIYFQR